MPDLTNLTHLSDLESLRQSYAKGELRRADLDPNPFQQFSLWLQKALDCQLKEPYAMTLATASRSGRPSARTVLLRQFDKDGAVFYSNYDSHKGEDLAENPFGEILFFWAELEQQVRISGRVEKLCESDSTSYFHKRPHKSQLAACASIPQSGVIADREVLEQRFVQLNEQYPVGSDVPKPEFWGGYRLIPDTFEFWQGRQSRLHDRLQYRLQESDCLTEKKWVIERLMP
ncbi:MAG: pyridoxamine 5'-phosphate oxidase [Candidatus Saccharibacteria bacterium]|nr:pyridoxamine 5'-phosphate oxidase [Moraxellaceae bacterium]